MRSAVSSLKYGRHLIVPTRNEEKSTVTTAMPLEVPTNGLVRQESIGAWNSV